MGEGEDPKMLAQELRCNLSSSSTSYLGLPLGVRDKTRLVWDAVKERFRKR